MKCVISGPLAALNIIAKIMSNYGQPNKPQQVDTICETQIAIPFVSTSGALMTHFIFTFSEHISSEMRQSAFMGKQELNTIPKTLQNIEVAKCGNCAIGALRRKPDLHQEVQRASASIKYEVYFKLLRLVAFSKIEYHSYNFIALKKKAHNFTAKPHSWQTKVRSTVFINYGRLSTKFYTWIALNHFTRKMINYELVKSVFTPELSGPVHDKNNLI